MNTIAEDIALSRRYARRSDRMIWVLYFAVAGILAIAIWDGLWPPRNSTSTSHTGKSG
jgi:hypothetical protein